MEQHKLIMIEDEDGNLLIYTAARSKEKSWSQFFNVHPFKTPLEYAIKAYSAIGYRAVEVELGSIRAVQSQWSEEDGYHVDVFGDPEPIRGRVV